MHLRTFLLHRTTNNPYITIQFIKFAYYNGKFFLEEIATKMAKLPTLVVIAGAIATTFITSFKSIKNTFKKSLTLIKQSLK